MILTALYVVGHRTVGSRSTFPPRRVSGRERWFSGARECRLAASTVVRIERGRRVTMRGAEVTMKSRLLLGIGFGVVAVSAVLAQGQAPANPAVNLQATNDPRYGEVIAKCKTPPPGR